MVRPNGTNRVESMQAEVSALHEAMAALHGEMGAIQRELDGATSSQEKLSMGEKYVIAEVRMATTFSK